MCGVACRPLPFHQVLFGAEAFSRPGVVPYCRLSLLVASRQLCSLGVAANSAQCVGGAGWEGCTGAGEQWVGGLDAQKGNGICEGPGACAIPGHCRLGIVFLLQPHGAGARYFPLNLSRVRWKWVFWAVVKVEPLRMKTFLQWGATE